MAASIDRRARLFLRFAAPFAGLRRLPLLGPCLRWASALFVPRDSLTWVQVRSGAAAGLWLHLNPRTGHSYWEGAVEPEVQEAIVRHLRPGMTFYDIGANIGFFSLLAARLVGPAGHVVSFEADPEIAARLREHVARNDFSSITAEHKAVWSESSTVFFARADSNASPDRGLGHVAAAGGSGTISVAAVSLDEYAPASALPDFLKCDVEGAEVEVFRGASKLLSEKRPILLCEMHSEENRRILLEQWSALGYACHPCGKDHVLALPL